MVGVELYWRIVGMVSRVVIFVTPIVIYALNRRTVCNMLMVAHPTPFAADFSSSRLALVFREPARLRIWLQTWPELPTLTPPWYAVVVPGTGRMPSIRIFNLRSLVSRDEKTDTRRGTRRAGYAGSGARLWVSAVAGGALPVDLHEV